MKVKAFFVLCSVLISCCIFSSCLGKTKTDDPTIKTMIGSVDITSDKSREKSESVVESEEKDKTEKASKSEKSASSSTSASKTTQAAKKENSGKITYIDGILVVNKTYSIPADYAPGEDPEARKAFDAMRSAAKEEGYNIWITSGYRSYSLQKSLYTRYVNNDGKAAADTYSARPGHSEHQTGLAFDIVSENMQYLSYSFGETEEGKWVSKHCHEYGFIIRYPKGKEDKTGFTYEPWHIRYLGKEKATDVYNSGKCLEEYLGITSQYSE